jgi:hypothetical protein
VIAGLRKVHLGEDGVNALVDVGRSHPAALQALGVKPTVRTRPARRARPVTQVLSTLRQCSNALSRTDSPACYTGVRRLCSQAIAGRVVEDCPQRHAGVVVGLVFRMLNRTGKGSRVIPASR